MRPFFRDRCFEKEKRREEKEKKRTNWFNKNDNIYSTVFFVPPTPNSELLKRLSKVEEIYKIGDTSRVKFVELSGVRYKDFYKSSDPYTRNCFPEDDCFLCKDQRSTAPPFRNQGQEQSSTSKTLDEENQTSTAPPMVKSTFCKTSSVGYSIACQLCKQRNRVVT